MVPIYIALAVVIAVVLGALFAFSAYQNHQRDAIVAFESATPTPGPNPTTKPIQLANLGTVGKPIGFPKPDMKRGILSNTVMGGRGQNVDGIPCETQEQVLLHIHSHLALFYDGTQVQIPAFIGMVPTALGGCLYWLHTHDASGIIHIEAGTTVAPGGGPYTLGMFFDVWGQPLTRTQVGPFKGPVAAYVNGSPYSGDLAAIPLGAHQQIVLDVGKSIGPPPTYVFPTGD